MTSSSVRLLSTLFGALFAIGAVVSCGGTSSPPGEAETDSESAAISTCGLVPKAPVCTRPVCIAGDGWDFVDLPAGTTCPGGKCNGYGTCLTAPPPPQYCPTVDPSCTLWGAEGWPANYGFVTELGATGSCGTTHSHYADGDPTYFQLTEVALCTDTQAVRDLVGKYANWSGWRPIIGVNVCDKCLAVAPAGKIYVIWADQGPTCGSSCKLPWQ